jgi:hypothetical protein
VGPKRSGARAFLTLSRVAEAFFVFHFQRRYWLVFGRIRPVEQNRPLMTVGLIERLIKSDRSFAVFVSFEYLRFCHPDNTSPIIGSTDDRVTVVCDPIWI